MNRPMTLIVAALMGLFVCANAPAALVTGWGLDTGQVGGSASPKGLQAPLASRRQRGMLDREPCCRLPLASPTSAIR